MSIRRFPFPPNVFPLIRVLPMLLDRWASQAVAGTLHNVIYGDLDVEFDESLLNNSELLRRVRDRNVEINARRGRRGRTYLLPMVRTVPTEIRVVRKIGAGQVEMHMATHAAV